METLIFYQLNTIRQLIITFYCLLSSTYLHAQTNSIDINGDGALNILIIGTSKSIEDSFEEFSPNQIAVELQNILTADPSNTLSINIIAEDVYREKTITTGIGNFTTSILNYYCHSLMQYYYWPDGQIARMENLKGNNGTDWDYVIIGSDPYIVNKLPGYFSLGLNKIASKVKEGGAVPFLLMVWPKDESLLTHFEEFTYRAADGVAFPIQNIPAGLAWKALPTNKKDLASFHPSPNGSYVAAASIYSHIFKKSASTSQYHYDDVIADLTNTTLINEANKVHYNGNPSFISPYKGCEITDQNFIYNHGGTSTENGILGGLQWVVTKDQKTLQFSSTPHIHFNYGRSSMGSTHLYVVDPTRFDYSFGYPLHDDKSTGLLSMLYGLDKRVDGLDIETDLGVARKMINQSELPYARNVPLRTLIAQMMEKIPGVDIYALGDPWHLSSDANIAIAAFMYTILTGNCAVKDEVAPLDSASWRKWMSYKIGYETAWNVMRLQTATPCFGSPISVIENNNSTNDYYFFPNPTSGSFSIQLGKNLKAVTVTVSDLFGKQLFNETFLNMETLKLYLNEPPGVYIVTIKSGEKTSIKRLIKR